jgi:hypothetical protein
MLMIHQPADALKFMHSELGRLIEDRDQSRDVDYHDIISGGACLLRVQAEYEGPEGKRKRIFTRIVPAEEKSMRFRAEKEVAGTIHAAFWEGADAAPQVLETPREAHEARLVEIFQQERELAAERKLLETHSKSIALTPRWNAEGGPPSQGEPSAPGGCEMGVLMCTYAAQGWKTQLEELMRSGNLPTL